MSVQTHAAEARSANSALTRIYLEREGKAVSRAGKARSGDENEGSSLFLVAKARGLASRCQSRLVKTTAFIGLGMVGGSLAQGMQRSGDRILGWDVQPGVRSLAARSGIEIADPTEAAAEADLIVVSTPPAEAGGVIRDLLTAGARAVTDTASLKAQIFSALSEFDSDALGRWVGGHPMAGTQFSGWHAADPEVFVGMTWALVSQVQPDLRALFEVARLVEVFDGAMLAVDPDEHDRAVAFSSHSVQVLHQVLAGGLADRSALVHRLSGPALRDSTRLAESPLDGMWEEILEMNSEEVAGALDHMIDEISSARDAVRAGNSSRIRSLWRHGHLGRERLLKLRWHQRKWRSGSVPLGRWWPGLLELGREGALIRRPREESGALLCFERS